MYEDQQNGVSPIEERFQLTQASPSYKIQHVIFQPMRNDYRYRVKYFMKGGKEYQGPERTGRAERLFVNDVFDARRVIAVRGVGDFAGRIQTVFVDLEYKDAANNYTQVKSQALTAASPFFEWSVPVIDENGGTVTYKAQVAYRDGTLEQLPPTVASSNTIVLPPPAQAFLELQVVADQLDWNAVRLVTLSLAYQDLDNGVQETKTFIFSPTNKANQNWKVEQRNRQVSDYTYSVTYYLVDGLQKSVAPTTGHERILILDHRA